MKQLLLDPKFKKDFEELEGNIGELESDLGLGDKQRKALQTKTDARFESLFPNSDDALREAVNNAVKKRNDAVETIRRRGVNVVAQIYETVGQQGGRDQEGKMLFSVGPPALTVVVHFAFESETYVGIITPKEDQASHKMLGGKCEVIYAINSDHSLHVAYDDDKKETALKGFIEETGADKDSSRSIRAIASLPSQLCLNGRHLHAKQKLKNFMKGGLKATNIRNVPVKDNRTTQNAGYLTTVYSVEVLGNEEMMAVLLVLGGGSDAENYFFCPLEEVQMHLTHESLFGKFRDSMGHSIRM
ncbi:hypothetical protein S40288_11713 [Stachybotrys chartarum IBT 40288]|nr:hypothetical protein S40288_11713 [Stachybotrys chartarum IBT 40288]